MASLRRTDIEARFPGLLAILVAEAQVKADEGAEAAKGAKRG